MLIASHSMFSIFFANVAFNRNMTIRREKKNASTNQSLLLQPQVNVTKLCNPTEKLKCRRNGVCVFLVKNKSTTRRHAMPITIRHSQVTIDFCVKFQFPVQQTISLKKPLTHRRMSQIEKFDFLFLASTQLQPLLHWPIFDEVFNRLK